MLSDSRRFQNIIHRKMPKTTSETLTLWHLNKALEEFIGRMMSLKATSPGLQSQITRNCDGTKTFSISEDGKQRRMVLLLSSTHASCSGCTNNTEQNKGQIFGAALRLCASGASAEAAPYGDQRHPHAVKCQARRRAREPEPKCRGEDKTCFIVVVNLGVPLWKGQGSTPWHRAPPRTFSNGRRERTHATMLPLFCHPSATYMPVSARFCIEETWIFCVIMFLKPFGAKYAVEPLYGSTSMVDCEAHELKFFLTRFL